MVSELIRQYLALVPVDIQQGYLALSVIATMMFLIIGWMEWADTKRQSVWFVGALIGEQGPK